MKEKVFLGTLICFLVLLIGCSQGDENEFSRGDIPQTGEHGDILTAAERMDYIREREWETFIGTPIEFIQGNVGVDDFHHNDYGRGFTSTDYYFRVIEWLWGEEPEGEIIRVRSNAGNIFEIGGEYTVAVIFSNRVLDPQAMYIVGSQIRTLDNSEVSELELQAFHEDIRNFPPREFGNMMVIEEAVPTLEFLEHVDVALIGKVTGMSEHSSIEGVYRIRFDVEDVVYTVVSLEFLSDSVPSRYDAIIGNNYLFLLNTNDYGSGAMPVARNGSLIPHGSDEFHQFIELFESVNQESD